MDWSAIVLIELVLVFGSVLVWGGWELWTLRRDRLRSTIEPQPVKETGQAQDSKFQPPGDAP